MNTFIILLAKAAIWLSRFLGGGSSFPGKLALKLNKNILKTVAQGYEVVLVTGTNGKTTTCAMLYSMLKKSGRSVINNSSGANMLTGITTCFLQHYRFFKKQEARFAVIEVDEAYARYVTQYVKPRLILVTNLFRDQLDRFGEVYTTWEMIKEAILKTPESTLVLNADEAIFAETGLSNPVVYYGFNVGEKAVGANNDAMFCQNCGAHLCFSFTTFGNLGDYHCPSCGKKRPGLTYHVDKIEDLCIKSSRVVINGTPVTVGVPGLYNVYNALSAFAAAHLLGLAESEIAQSLAMQESKFGRHEVLNVEGHTLHIVLIKNPTGCDGCIDTVALERGKCDLVLMLNDNYADGTDISWIWDAHFERLSKMDCDHVFICGERRYDMAVRAKTAGLDRDKFIICDSDSDLVKKLSGANEKVYVFATYTAMTGFRKYLFGQGFIDKKKIWK